MTTPFGLVRVEARPGPAPGQSQEPGICRPAAGTDDPGMAGAERTRRRALERVAAAAREAADPEALYARLVGALAVVMPVESACWHLNDPLTGVLTRTGALGEPPGSYEQALELEFMRDDVAGIAEVIRRPRPVAILSVETRGEPGRSPRYREMLAPDGAADELRAGLRRPLRAVGLHRPVRLGPASPRTTPSWSRASPRLVARGLRRRRRPARSPPSGAAGACRPWSSSTAGTRSRRRTTARATAWPSSRRGQRRPRAPRDGARAGGAGAPGGPGPPGPGAGPDPRGPLVPARRLDPRGRAAGAGGRRDPARPGREPDRHAAAGPRPHPARAGDHDARAGRLAARAGSPAPPATHL